MKLHLSAAVLAALTTTACSTLEGSHRLNMRAGLEEIKAGRLDGGRLPTASIELETSGPGEPASGIVVFDWTGGTAEDVDFEQGAADADLQRLGARLGLKVRPDEGWGWSLVPYLAGGLGWTRLSAEAAGVKRADEDVSLWAEAGAELGHWSLGLRLQRPDLDLGEEIGDVRAAALVLGYGVSF